MVTTLVMQNKEKKHEISKLKSDHNDWKVIESDDYDEALNIIQSGDVDALALAAAIGAEKIILVGFDGFPSGDPRYNEMNEIFYLFSERFSEIIVKAITPTTYNISQSSIYAYK